MKLVNTIMPQQSHDSHMTSGDLPSTGWGASRGSSPSPPDTRNHGDCHSHSVG